MTEKDKADPSDSEGATVSTTDMTAEQLVHKMRAHEYLLLPDGNFSVPMSGEQMSVVLDCLFRVHNSMIAKVMDDKLTEQQKQIAYHNAHKTEQVYDHLMKKLKLYRFERGDMN